MSISKKSPVNVYIDGFNLYHAIEKLEKPDIKWLNYRKLSETFIRGTEYLKDVYLFTSMTPWNKEKKDRHALFLQAQRAVDVDVVEARFKKSRRHCRSSDKWCKFWEEKESDVAIAVQMLADAFAGKTRRMILITADTDQIPTIKYLQAAFGEIELMLAVPPNRKNQARDLSALFNPTRGRVELDEGRLRSVLLPRTLVLPDKSVIECPPEYR